MDTIACDCCGTPMALSPLPHGGGRAVCPRPGCGQEHCVDSQGFHGYKVLARLYPSGMRPGSAMHREAAAHAREGLLLYAALCEAFYVPYDAVAVRERAGQLAEMAKEPPSLASRVWRRLTG